MGFDAFYKDGKPYFKTEPTQMLVDFLEVNPGYGQWALDLGCGNGRNSVAIANSGFRCIAFEKSMAAFKSFRSTFLIPNQMKLIAGDSTRLPFSQGLFSLVFCGTVLSCLNYSDIKKVFSEFRRCIAPDGILLFSDFSINDPGACGSSSSLSISECANEVKTYFRQEELLGLLRGFSVQRMWEVKKEDLSHGIPHEHALIRFVARKN